MRPVVGVVSGSAMPGHPARYRVNQAYIDALAAAGALPLVVFPAVEVAPLLERLDGVVLTGGPDVDPALYGQERHPETQDPDLRRDEFELELVRTAYTEGKPVLAICRGHQVLNVAFGGTLLQHLDGHPRGDSEGDRSEVKHSVRLDPHSVLGELLGTTELAVNSLHHQAVAELAPELRAVGWSEDGVVEALEAENILSVQFHPEELVDTQPWSRRLFEAFVERIR